MARVDYDKQSAAYDRGRTLPAEALATWALAAKRHIGDADRVLDLGSGTGRFSAVIAEALAADVIGVEPSAGMRGHALTKPRPDVRVVAGAAEHVPLRDSSVDAAWLSNVIHHFDDIAAATRELRRVVAPGGTVLVRGAFGGRDVPSLYRFFPGAQNVVDSMPTIPDVIEAFQDAGFTSFLNERVEQLLAHNLADMVPRIRTRADTTLELLPDEEFERGLELLEAAARVEHGPVLDSLDLLVVR
jgi:ubiquinone/menaquinone biosynthesis C-methylase UbiE